MSVSLNIKNLTGQIRQNREWQIVILLFLSFFLLIAANTTGRTVRDTLLLSSSLAEHLPWFFIATAVVVTLTIFFFNRLRLGKLSKHFTTLTLVFFALSLIPFFFSDLSDPWVAGLYIWIDVVNSVAAVQFWVLASNLVSPRRAKKLYGPIGAGGSIGGLLFGLIIPALARNLGSTVLIILTAILLLLSAFLLLRAEKKVSFNERDEFEKPEARKNVQGGLRDPYIQALIWMIIPAVLVTTFIDYQFKHISGAFYPDKDNLASFFGIFYAWCNGLALFFQFVLTGTILARFGILVGLLALPLTIFLSTGSLFTATFFPAAQPLILGFAAVSRAAEQILKFTLANTSLQLLWIPVPRRKKQRVKLVVDGVIKTVLQGLAGFMMVIFALFIDYRDWNMTARVVAFTVLILSAVWAVTALMMKRRYRLKLAELLRNQQIDLADFTGKVQDEQFIRQVSDALQSKEVSARAFAMELINGMSPAGWKAELLALLRDPNPLIATRAFELLSTEPKLVDNETLRALLEEPPSDELFELATSFLIRQKREELYPRLALAGGEPLSRKKIASMAGLLLISRFADEDIRRFLRRVFTTSGQAVRKMALRVGRFLPDAVAIRWLQWCLISSTAEVRSLALRVVARKGPGNPVFLPLIMFSLYDRTTRAPAIRALEECPREALFQEIERQVAFLENEGGLAEEHRVGLFRALGRFPHPGGVNLILTHLEPEETTSLREGTEALIGLVRKFPLDKTQEALVHRVLGRIVRRLYEYFIIRDQSVHGKQDPASGVPGGMPGDFLLTDYLENETRRMMAPAVQLAILDKPETPIQSVILKLENPGRFRLFSALELLENTFSLQERAWLIPLLESPDPAYLAQTGRRLFGRKFLPAGKAALTPLLERFAVSPRPWHRFLAVEYWLRHDPGRLAELDWHQMPEYDLTRRILGEALVSAPGNIGPGLKLVLESKALRHRHLPEVVARNPPTIPAQPKPEEFLMLPTLDKILMLKSIRLFQEIPAEDLAHLLEIAGEANFAEGETIFQTGEPGTALYIVLSGRVEVSRAGRRIASLKRGDFLGEMAILDNEPRSADAICLSECQLLKIEQSGFYELMASRRKLLEGIIRLLTGRLRNTLNIAGQNPEISADPPK